MLSISCAALKTESLFSLVYSANKAMIKEKLHEKVKWGDQVYEDNEYVYRNDRGVFMYSFMNNPWAPLPKLTASLLLLLRMNKRSLTN